MTPMETAAAEFALKAHGDQKRKYTGAPYIEHPAAVADIVRSVPHTEAMLAAAWLHDVVEDTPVTLDESGERFGDEVRTLVYWLTDVSRPEDGNRATRKKLDRDHLAAAPAEAQTIKLADMISNGKSIAQHDPEFAVVYRREKLALLEVMTKGDPRLRARAQVIMDEAVPFNPRHLSHPADFKAGVRILMLKARRKDGALGKERTIMRQSNSAESFDEHLAELRLLMRPHERIYASASRRNLMKAGRTFAERLIASTFDPPEVRESFHRRTMFHWYSCLMQPESAERSTKWWMFDCDSRADYDAALTFADGMERYEYGTKNGWHVLVRPYNRQMTPDGLGKVLYANPLMLWSYS